MALLALLALLTLFAAGAHGADVLAVFPYNGHSHFAMVEPLMTALADRGHRVTVISPFPRRNRTANYADVDVSDALPPVVSQLSVVDDFEPENPVSGLRNLCHMNHRVCEATFAHPQVQALIRDAATGRRRFDVVFAEAFSTDCFAAFAHAFAAPLISMRTAVASPHVNQRVANPQNPAYLVNHLLAYSGHAMTFGQRLINALATHLGAAGYYAFSDGPATELARRHFGVDTPPMSHIVRRTALVLVNSHHSLTQSRPVVPNVVEVGGIHIRPRAENATNEWSDYCDSCDRGIVYVSFGSLLKGASFPDHFVTSFIRAFEALPYCVLWKYEGKMESKRIKISKWMPQQQILSHKNVKVFITHGGLMGVMEAVHFGVPMIGIPVFGDQQSNVANCVEKGIAIGLDYRQITERKLIRSIQAIVTEDKYQLKSSEISIRFRDRPMSALNTAIFWTEYVIRHGYATNTASAAINLEFYQYCLLDVLGTIISALLFLFYLVYLIKNRIL